MGLQYTKRPSQPIGTVRRGVQAAFLALNAWIGVQFYLWVRYFESGGTAVYVPRPPGVEGWLPIASLMNLNYFLLTYSVPDVHPAGMFLLIAFVECLSSSGRRSAAGCARSARCPSGSGREERR